MFAPCLLLTVRCAADHIEQDFSSDKDEGRNIWNPLLELFADYNPSLSRSPEW